MTANLSWETFREVFLGFTPQDLNAWQAGGMEGGERFSLSPQPDPSEPLFCIVARQAQLGRKPISQTKRVSELPRMNEMI